MRNNFPKPIDMNKVKQMKEFASRILRTLEKLPKDDSHKLNRLYYLESQLTVKELTTLLKQFAESEEEIHDDEQLKLFYDFLQKRRERFIEGRTNPKTKADRACETLANELCKEANTRQYKSHEPNELLKAMPMALNGVDPETHLKQALLSDIASREKLLTTLLILDRTDWLAYCDNIELTTLIKIASNEKNAVDDVLNIQDNNQDEEYQRAASFCKAYIYLKDRMKGPQFKSYTGALLDLLNLKKIPNMADKSAAALALINFLASSTSIKDFDDQLNNAASNLFQYREILEDGQLKKIIAELKEFSKKNEKKESVQIMASI